MYDNMQEMIKKGEKQPKPDASHKTKRKREEKAPAVLLPEKHSKGKDIDPMLNPSVPIILVPSAASSLITIFNAHDFLAEGVFIPTESKRAVIKEKPASVAVKRMSSTDKFKDVTYLILDNPKAVPDWNRVVAIFASGQQWQFSDFPAEWKTPAQIFHRACGFHLAFEDEPLNKTVQSWKVHKLLINKVKRYQDRPLVVEFWQILCDSLAAKNSDKRLNF